MHSRIEENSGSIADTYEGFVIDNRLGIAALVILVYEYLLTFEREVNLFWKSRITGAGVLFFLNRYVVLVTSLLSISGIVVDIKTSSCGFIAKMTNVFAMLQYVPWAAFSALRVYALSNNCACGVLVFLLSVAPVGAALAHLALGLTGEMDPVFGCIVVDPTTPEMAHKLTIGSRTCLIVADVLIILITWKTIPPRCWAHGQSSTFGTILLRNGTLYFVVLLVMNLLHLVFTVVSVCVTSPLTRTCGPMTKRAQVSAPFQAASYVILFIHPITGILMSRFLFDLQDANRRSLCLDSHDPLHFSADTSDGSLSFARVIGSLGSSLPPPPTYDEYDYDYGYHHDGDDASCSTIDSSKPSLVVHITRQTTVCPDMLELPAYDGTELDVDVLSFHARKVAFDESVIAWDNAKL
ncbi:hypothetical protein L226DRAFT_540571 [Lentinus tigrinus ALCF2SS1-7]|uniref:DUF6533 domain-containing protein n=1 Tax=Lentinus tigrinus ALCF2SS1-6 TaxID=1328759 RepID=A0A5C2RSF0_9APHY|nr:hypothetical protein L227DRAFT_581424 [Lentinus tigrinus ALCF2SS1-6]RPD68566.1 hypothetical protein L226DRAFT_540571 [Lentinus tigrinus ALCF2SS1-7]